MGGTTPGYDRKNAWLYVNAVAVLLLASLVLLVRILIGNPPDYVTNSFASGCLFFVCAVVSVASLVGLKKSAVRGFYLLAAPLASFIAAAYVSGFPTKAILILSASCFMMLGIVFFMGDKADQNSKEHRIKIKLPW
jgi:hypothetical protein